MELWIILLFGIVVFMTHFLEGITGFGCTVLALPFAIMLVGIKTAVPTLVFLALLLALYIVIIDQKQIIWKEFFRIVTFVGAGVPVGIFLFSYLPEGVLKKILALFMIFVSARGLYVSCKPHTKKINLPAPIMNVILFIGGCIHGAFSSGGPLVVIYATKALPNKNNFRATLCMLWVSLNTVIVAQNMIRGVMTFAVWKLLLFTLPFLIAGAILGNWAHHRIKDIYFTQIVYGVLFISGFFMFF